MDEASSVEDGGSTIEATWLTAHAHDEDIRVVEVDVSPGAYNAGHIPNAVLWNAYADLRDRDYKPIGAHELERLLSRSGIARETELVFYGYGAALGFWLMKAHGHAKPRMLVGSREQWLQAGGQWSTDVPAPVESSYALPVFDANVYASQADVESAIGDTRQVLLDVRSDLEYNGERFWPSGAIADAGRPGHIPGAISVPIDLLRNEDDTFKASEELRLALDRAGVTSEKKVIVYCTIGNRASQAWYALKHLLGYPDVSVYYGSWVEWGKATETEVET